MGKKFYESKTFWMNIIAVVGILLFKNEAFIAENPEAVGAILVVLNLLLRLLTKKPIIWT